MVRLPEFLSVKMITLPVWLNRGAPATSRRPFLADTTDVTVYPVYVKEKNMTYKNANTTHRLKATRVCSLYLSFYNYPFCMAL